jgi:hypothetical protein
LSPEISQAGIDPAWFFFLAQPVTAAVSQCARKALN